MSNWSDRYINWEHRQTELWDRIFQVTQDVVTVAENLSDTIGMDHVRKELVAAVMAVGANVVRANAVDDAAQFDKYVVAARMRAIEADYWLRVIYVLQQHEGIRHDLSSVISQLAAIIRLLKVFIQQTPLSRPQVGGKPRRVRL